MGELVTENKSDVGWKNVTVFQEHKGSQAEGRQKNVPSLGMVSKIIREARELAGALHHPKKQIAVDWNTNSTSEIDLEASLNANPFFAELKVVQEEAIATSLLICVDTSLSMTGEKFRIAATAIATSALHIGVDNLALISFGSDAFCLKSIGEKLSLSRLVERFLEHHPKGLTNMEAALKLAVQESKKSQLPPHRNHAVLISDGRFTAGSRPDYLVPSLPRLSCIQTGSPWSQNRHFRNLAVLGAGHFQHVSDFSLLPKRLYEFSRLIAR